MLRPTCLPPGERLSPVPGLLTLRFGRTSLLVRREPATRRVSAYRDGTCTRWIRTARVRVPTVRDGQGSVLLTTNHASRYRPAWVGGCGRRGVRQPRAGGLGAAPMAAAR